MVLAVSGPVGSGPPEGALVPNQPPEAVQAVAFVEDQVSVEGAPLATDVGFAASDTVGTGGDVPPLLLWVSPPPPPPQVASRRHKSRRPIKRVTGPNVQAELDTDTIRSISLPRHRYCNDSSILPPDRRKRPR